MSKHTPGPWEAANTKHVLNDCMWVVFADEAEVGSRIPAECYGPDAEANAHLIAAAPELLEALRELREFCTASARVIAIADAAIAKAEGRS